MNTTSTLNDRSDELFREQRSKQCVETDRLFAFLMVAQWIGGIIAALLVSPHTWIGDTSSVHAHVWFAVFFGAVVSSLPITLALTRPGTASTRHAIAFAQMIWSALLIHFFGGRIETHFHIFGSLAFLAFYRDWKVMVTATVVVAVDHMVRGLVWPQSVFGVFVESPWLWFEHACWVVFEDIFLVIGCIRGIRETREICDRRAELEFTNAKIERKVDERTRDLALANAKLAEEIDERQEAEARGTRLGRLIEESLNEVYLFDAETLKFLDVNRGARENLGYSLDELREMTPLDLQPDFDEATFRELVQPLVTGSRDMIPFETRHRRNDGSHYPVEVHLQLSRQQARPQFVAMILDATERRRAEAERDSAREKLLDASRQAGMAEVATTVLHNVGNVLNSVNVSANLLTERLFDSRLCRLSDSVRLLEEHGDSLPEFLLHDERGRHLPRYLRQLSDTLEGERNSLRGEIDQLVKNVDHIKHIISTQQSYARISGTRESVDLVELIEDALQVVTPGLQARGIHVVRDVARLPPVETDRHKVMQILINLLTNARHAMEDSDRDKHQLTIRLCQDNDATAILEVTDTGTGIPTENLVRVFSHGFTTRRDGHGFGLHSSANSAAELGGSITAGSPGCGHGATFRLRLPLAPDSAKESHTSTGQQLSPAQEVCHVRSY